MTTEEDSEDAFLNDLDKASRSELLVRLLKLHDAVKDIDSNFYVYELEQENNSGAGVLWAKIKDILGVRDK